MTTSGIEKLVWALVYGGLLVASLGVFLQRQHQPLGWTLIVGGGLAAVAGAVLIWVRSRMKS